MRSKTCIIIAWLLLVFPAWADDWPQAAANPARTAHSADEPGPGYEIAWVKSWGDEVLFNTSGPIVVKGKVFVGTQNGIVHAIDVKSGDDAWAANVAAPIVHALASDGQLVYAAAFDGAVYALDINSGREVWKAKLSRRGFSAAPLLMDGNIFIGNRDGVFYAVQTGTGKEKWKTDTGAPIVQTAAGAEGRIVFVNDAIKAFCLNAHSGKVLWSTRIPGGSVRDYWPVIHKGKIVIRTHPAGPKRLGGGIGPLQKKFFWPVRYGSEPTQINFKAKSIDDIVAEQDTIADFYRRNPSIRTCVVLNLADGNDLYPTSLLATCVNGGVTPPPALAGDGRLYATFRTSAARRGLVDITRCALGHFNIETGKIDRPILCGGPEGVDKVVGVRQPFELTSDETVTLSSGGNLIFGMRCNEGPGAVDVVTRKTFKIANVQLPRASDLQPTGNSIVISGKYVLFTKFNHVICIEGNKESRRRPRVRGSRK